MLTVAVMVKPRRRGAPVRGIDRGLQSSMGPVKWMNSLLRRLTSRTSTAGQSLMAMFLPNVVVANLKLPSIECILPSNILFFYPIDTPTKVLEHQECIALPLFD